MARIRLDKGFEKAFKRHSYLAGKIEKTLETFMENPAHPSLNFEPVDNFAGHFTIRVNLHVRILLREEQDEHGLLYALRDMGNHDQIYRRRK